MDTSEEHGLLSQLLTSARAERVEPITERLVASIARENFAYDFSGVVPDGDLWRSCHDNVERVLDMLVVAVRPDGSLTSVEDMDLLFDAARATGRRRAKQGLPLDDVLRSYRIGGRLIWEDLVERADPPLDSKSFRDLGVWLWASVDKSSAEVASSYRRVEQQMLHADSQRMAALWEGLLSGRAREQAFAHEAARAMDVPASSALLVLLVHDSTPQDAAGAVDPVVQPLGAGAVWQGRAGGDVIALVTLSAQGDHRPVLDALTGLSGVDGGVSGVCHGLADVDDAFEQARVAAEGLGSGSGIAAYDERLVPALLLSSPQITRRLIAYWLGPLLDLPDAERAELVLTLAAWAEAGGSTSRAALALPCHRNTVLNRLRRISALTGHRLLDTPPPVGLSLALQAHSLDIA
ncbi:PucR family transcriptional regulator [Janibacter cremeus]|uniref:PucR family transcriptional regulator n=1 Tax=Janibacter cremeus TaxID=1285192 RepID=A0A852VSR6_9MICO|nr:PucR family transcriptional regulator [Janibacter cremeus]NYF97723.1 hypothetical protein [Janibacter cremeus]